MRVLISWRFPDNPLRQLIKCYTQRGREKSRLCSAYANSRKESIGSSPPVVRPVLSALLVGLHKDHRDLPILQLSPWVAFCLCWMDVRLLPTSPFDTTPFWQHQRGSALRKKAVCCGRQGCGKHIFLEKYPDKGTPAKEPRSKLSLDRALPWQEGGIYLAIFFVRKMVVGQCKERGSDFNLFLICESNHSSPCVGTASLSRTVEWSQIEARGEKKKRTTSRLHSLLRPFLFSCCVSPSLCSSRYALTSCKSNALCAATTLWSARPGEYTFKSFL